MSGEYCFALAGFALDESELKIRLIAAYFKKNRMKYGISFFQIKQQGRPTRIFYMNFESVDLAISFANNHQKPGEGYCIENI